MRLRASCAAAMLLLPGAARAAPIGFVAEPVSIAGERLDALYDRSGLASRHSVRIGTGGAVTLGACWSVGLGLGVASGSTGFGLQGAASALLVRHDMLLELRGRVPGRLLGFGMQVAGGGGRLALRYKPERIAVPVEGVTYTVELSPVTTWTRHVAAEILHAVPGGEIALRGVWRSYAIDVASPDGIARQSARDVMLGLVLRVGQQ